jgi:hypothetical protein
VDSPGGSLVIGPRAFALPRAINASNSLRWLGR